MAGLGYCSEHYLAVMSTRPTIGVSGRKGDFSCHVCPSRRGRTSHFPSLHSHSAGCIYEGTEEEKAGWGQCPGWVVNAAWAPCCVHWCMTRLLVAWWYVGVGLPTSGGTIISHPFLWPTVLEKGFFALSDFIHSWKWECLDRVWSSTSALSGWCMRGLARLARKAFQFSLILAVMSRYLPFAWVTPFKHVLATVGHKVSNYWKYGILRAAEDVVRAGVLSYAPGSESVHMFHLSHFHRLVSFCWFGFGCWGGSVCFAVAFFLSTDQSVRSSCQPMTSLAYLHDCHCRYDERSIVQKKNFNRLYLDHCWTTGSLQLGVQLNTAESRTGFGILLPFTVKELMEPLQMELNCNKIFGTNCRGLVGPLHSHCEPSWNWCTRMWSLTVPGKAFSLMSHCQRKVEADWQLLKKRLALPRWMWRSLDCLLDLRRWLWLSLVTETEYTFVIFEATVFEHCYVDWCTEVLEVGSLKKPTCTLHHVWLTLFSWLQTVFFTDLQVW